MEVHEGLLAVVVVGVDDGEGSPHLLPGAQHRLARAPGLAPALGQRAGDVVERLEGVAHRHAQPGAHRLDAVADGRAEVRLDVPAYDEHHAVEARLDGVVDRVVHDDVAVVVHTGQLLDAPAEAAADARGHDEQRRFHIISFRSVV